MWVQLFSIPQTSNIIVFLCLTCFTYHYALKVHSSCYKWQDFLGWIKFLLCMYTSIFFTHSTIVQNIYIVSISWYCDQCCNECLNTIYLFEILFSFPLDIYTQMQNGSYDNAIFEIFWENLQLFSITVAVQAYIPNNTHSLFSTFSPIFSHYFLSLMVTILIALKWHLIVVLINILWRRWASFHAPISHLYIFFWKISIQSLPTVSSDCFFAIDFYEFFIYWYMYAMHGMPSA